MTARDFPNNTCGATRLAEMLADELEQGRVPLRITEEPRYVGSMLRGLVEEVWRLRTENAALTDRRFGVTGGGRGN